MQSLILSYLGPSWHYEVSNNNVCVNTYKDLSWLWLVNTLIEITSALVIPSDGLRFRSANKMFCLRAIISSLKQISFCFMYQSISAVCKSSTPREIFLRGQNPHLHCKKAAKPRPPRQKDYVQKSLKPHLQGKTRTQEIKELHLKSTFAPKTIVFFIYLAGDKCNYCTQKRVFFLPFLMTS